MKLLTKDTLLGRFYVVQLSGKTLSLVGASAGYDDYDSAEAQLKQASVKSLADPYLILQVTGEFRFKAQLVPVHGLDAA